MKQHAGSPAAGSAAAAAPPPGSAGAPGLTCGRRAPAQLDRSAQLSWHVHAIFRCTPPLALARMNAQQEPESPRACRRCRHPAPGRRQRADALTSSAGSRRTPDFWPSSTCQAAGACLLCMTDSPTSERAAAAIPRCARSASTARGGRGSRALKGARLLCTRALSAGRLRHSAWLLGAAPGLGNRARRPASPRCPTTSCCSAWSSSLRKSGERRSRRG